MCVCRPLAIFLSSLDKLCLHGDTTRTDLDLSVPAKGKLHTKILHTKTFSAVPKNHILLQHLVSEYFWPHDVCSNVTYFYSMHLWCKISQTHLFVKIFCIPRSVQTPWCPVEGAVTKWPHNCLWRRRSSISPQAAAVNMEGMWTFLCFREWRFSGAPLMIRYLRNHETGIYPQIFRYIPQKAASQRWASAPYSSKYYRNKSNTNISAIYSNGLYHPLSLKRNPELSVILDRLFL